MNRNVFRFSPLQITTKIQRILRADRVVRPYKRPHKTQHFSVSRRRGRCPHRPAGTARFMAVFRRNHVDFPFYVVGAGFVRPPELPFLRRFDANSQHFRGPMWASAPTNNHENSTNFEGGQSRPPLQCAPGRVHLISTLSLQKGELLWHIKKTISPRIFCSRIRQS